MSTWDSKWAQRGVTDPESVGSDELREPPRRNSPSDPTSRDIENHVLTGMQFFGHGVQLVFKGMVEPRDTKGEGRNELEDGSKLPVVSWDCCFLGARNRTTEAEVEQRGDSLVPVRHDGGTESIFCSFDSRKRS